MKLWRIIAAFALLAPFAGPVLAEDADIKELRATVAAQAAELRDLKAKMYTSHAEYDAENLTSLQKNAKVKIGGVLNTRYFSRTGKVDSHGLAEQDFNIAPPDPAQNPQSSAQYRFDHNSPYGTRAKANISNFGITDAKIDIDIQVNDYFGAFARIDLQGGPNGAQSNGFYDNAERYYVYWKNICNTGFGLQVGRDLMHFGQGDNPGQLATYVSKSGDGISELRSTNDPYFNAMGYAYLWGATPGSLFDHGLIPPHNGWDRSGVTQLTPYWEGLDGKLRVEASLIQNIGDNDSRTGYYNANANNPNASPYYRVSDDGLGSFTGRVVYKPIEGLKMSASVLNFYNRSVGQLNDDPNWQYPYAPTNEKRMNKNNTAVDLAVSWRPAFLCSKLMLWTEWLHSFNAAHYDNLDSDGLNFGFSYDFTDRVTFFAQGDMLYTDFNKDWTNHFKSDIWAFYTGLQYKFAYGVMLELGWKHEWVKYKDNTASTLLKARGDTVYGHVGFTF